MPSWSLSQLCTSLLLLSNYIHAQDRYEVIVLPGNVLQSDDTLSPKEEKNHDESITIPDSFDAREHWPECKGIISEIRDQGACGSCWAFASAEAMSDRLCIASKGKIKFRVSSEDLLECCTDCIFNASNKCQAGYAYKAWQYWVSDGIVSGGDALSYDQGCKPYSYDVFHYANPPSTCKSTCSNGETITSQYKTYGASSNYIRNNPKQMQIEIMKNGPVQTHIDFHPNLRTYEKGIYQLSGDKIGGHSVRLIGWGKNSSGFPYWIALNSFGTNWGIDGAMLIPRGSNYIKVESQVVFGMPKLN